MCPTCHSEEVRRSKRKTLLDRVMKLAGFTPYRCRECNKRFFVNGPTDLSLQNARRRRYRDDEEDAA